MNTLPSWVKVAQTVWMAIGSLLVFASMNFNIQVPSFLSSIFSPEIFDMIVGTAGAVIALYQTIRALIITKSSSDLQAASAESTVNKVWYFINPFNTGK